MNFNLDYRMFGNKYYISFGRFKPVDIAVFLGVNILCGLYIWPPFYKEMYNKPNDAIKQNEEITAEKTNDNIDSKN